MPTTDTYGWPVPDPHGANQYPEDMTSLAEAIEDTVAGIGGGVTTFNGRSGAVVPVAGDYPKTHRMSFTYAVSGAVGNLTLPLMEVGLASGETKTLVQVTTKLSAGTITAQLRVNGTNSGSAISVTTTKSETTFAVVLNDLDDLDVVLSAGASSPTDLTFTIKVDSHA